MSWKRMFVYLKCLCTLGAYNVLVLHYVHICEFNVISCLPDHKAQQKNWMQILCFERFSKKQWAIMLIRM